MSQQWEQIIADRAIASAQLTAAHPYLVPVNAKCNSLVAAGKNIRIELARAFPGVKFSVTSSRFSGGNSIRVSWTDGPNSSQVDSIINRYSAGSFDGMTDCYNYEHSAWGDAFGTAKYVHSTRHYSDRWITAIMYRVAKRLGGMPRVATLDDYKQGRLWNFKTSGGCDYGREVNVALSDATAFPIAKENEALAA
jgi:hypothetical protein